MAHLDKNRGSLSGVAKELNLAQRLEANDKALVAAFDGLTAANKEIEHANQESFKLQEAASKIADQANQTWKKLVEEREEIMKEITGEQDVISGQWVAEGDSVEIINETPLGETE